MVELNGSEKQIIWADNIRKSYLEGLNNIKKKIEEMDRYIVRDYYINHKEQVHNKIKEDTSNEKKRALLEVIDEIIYKVENQEKASKIIDMYTFIKEVDTDLTTRIYRLW